MYRIASRPSFTSARYKSLSDGVRRAMSASSAKTYAATVHGDNPATPSGVAAPAPVPVQPASDTRHTQSIPLQKPDHSTNEDSHIPRTSRPEKEVYILTFLTDQTLRDKMTALRKTYFPPKLNRLDAHLTLFHALPGSKLNSDIIPVLRDIAGSTIPFRVFASTPFKLRRGIAIGVPKGSGGDDARAVHKLLKRRWLEFLSPQDAGGFATHYTIMNKVDTEKEVDDAFADVEQGWRPVNGEVLGLELWRYDRGGWDWQQEFRFAKQP